MINLLLTISEHPAAFGERINVETTFELEHSRSFPEWELREEEGMLQAEKTARYTMLAQELEDAVQEFYEELNHELKAPLPFCPRLSPQVTVEMASTQSDDNEADPYD